MNHRRRISLLEHVVIYCSNTESMPSHTATTHVTQCVGGVLAHSSVAASNSAATESSIWSNYPGTSSISLGIVHIIVGLLCVVCNAISIVTHSPLAVVGSGIWGGAFVSVLLMMRYNSLYIHTYVHM